MPPAHVPIYVASLGPGQPAPDRRARRRLDRQLVLPRDRASRSSTRSARAPPPPGADLADLDLTVSVGVEFTDDVEDAGRRHAEGYAFTFGAMGSATTNFYNEAFARQGYGDDVRAVQQLWLAGDRDAARRRVPTAIGLGTNLHRHRRHGPRAPPPLPRRRRHHAARPTPGRPARDLDRQLDDLGRLLDLVADVNRERHHRSRRPGNHDHDVIARWHQRMQSTIWVSASDPS